MKILKPISVAVMASIILSSCGSTKTATTTIHKEAVMVTATDSISPKKGEMSEGEIQAWPHTDVFTDSIPGMSLAKAYTFVKDKQGKTVIVAVIDSGIDLEHDDLKDVAWVNEDEIPNNGKDDDNNGFIDDIHGWNFLGGEKGQSNPEQLELTRIAQKLQPRFEGKAADSIIDDVDQTAYKLYQEVKKTIDEKVANATKQAEKATNQVNQYTFIKQFIVKMNDTIQKALAGKELNLENVNSLTFADPDLLQGKMMILKVLDSGGSISEADNELNELIKYYKGNVDHYNNQLNSQYKIGFKGRLSSDDPYDITDTNYGNPYIIGSKEDEMHGTHVSGIIAATRNNGVGMNGVAHNVKIMALRAVPDGDEYDKDIALAIRYAVDNNAKVINMSFGKSYSPNAQWVYDAIKYAESKDVLLVHAAGNDSSNIDSVENFPNDSKDKLVEFSDNVITVGAMTRNLDHQLVASFSNIGKKNVDVFAPGLEIYSTVPKNEYESIQGTSMAAPEVAGVAALVRSYYPNLSASQVKHILMDSGIEYHKEVTKPAKRGSKPELVNFDDLSVSGRILNAYNALVMADKMSKK